MPDLNFPRACGEPKVKATYNNEPEDFQVTEIPSFIPAGHGDHYFLLIRKRNLNTQAVVQSLCRQLGLKPVDIGYAGRKDKWAVTQQWFSLHAPKHSLSDIKQITDPGFQILSITRHHKKLRTGQLSGNEFHIQLTDIIGSLTDIKQRLTILTETGWPNYFGLQRFGKGGQNLIRGERMLSGKLKVKERNQRSMYVSACRAYLFNCVLAERVNSDNWQRQISGDVVNELGIPMGPLMGDGDSPATDHAADYEGLVQSRHQNLITGLQNARMAWGSRPFVLLPQNMIITENTSGIKLQFSLPKGAFATTILRELILF